jgi:hypothetical protein
MATQDSMFAGLFTTPEQYQQQQDQLANQQAYQMAQLTPEQRAQADIRGGFQRAGNALGGLMGAEDPQMKARSVLQELAGKYDTNTSGGVAALATELQQRGMQQQAMILGQRALEMRKTEAEAQAKTAEKLTNEQKNAAAGADASGAERGTTEWSNTYKTELARLTAGNKGANIKEIGVAEGTRQPVYFDVGTDTQFVVRQSPTDPTKQIRVPFNGGVDRTTAKTSIDARSSQETAFSKARGEAQAKAVEAASNDARSASTVLDRLGEMKRIAADPKLYTGPTANAALAATNLLQGFGLVSKEQASQLANGEMFQKYANDVTFQELNGKLGGNVSNADVEFIKSRLPQLTTSTKARSELINKLEEIQKGKVDYYTKMNAHANKFNNLNDFKFAEPSAKTVKFSDLPN